MDVGYPLSHEGMRTDRHIEDEHYAELAGIADVEDVSRPIGAHRR